MDRKRLINEYLVGADLTLIGFHEGMIRSDYGIETFGGYDKMGNVLFVKTVPKHP